MWRAGGLYFAMVFVFAFGLGAIRRLILEPRFSELVAVSIETPLLIVVMAFAARRVARRAGLSSAGLVGMGLIALGLQQIAELGLVYASGQTLGDYLRHFMTPPGIVFAAALVVFALMPPLVGRAKKNEGAA